ncbi:MAG: hypothetical protein R2713_06680 [Ilumatobacteraceae bacterium]
MFPHGAPIPTASNLNVDERSALLGADLAMPNLVTVPIGADGTVDVFSQRGGHVIVDMLGSYALSGATDAGRFQPLAAPRRVLDTREFALLGAGSTTEVRVAEAAGASSVVLNVTAIGSAAGYWTVYPTSAPGRPLAANLNSLGPFHERQPVIVPVDAEGDFLVFSQGGGHLVVDVVGTMTATGRGVDRRALRPARRAHALLDTRDQALNPLGAATMPLPVWNLEVAVQSHRTIGRPDVAALAIERHHHRHPGRRLRAGVARRLDEPHRQEPAHEHAERDPRRADPAQPRHRRGLHSRLRRVHPDRCASRGRRVGLLPRDTDRAGSRRAGERVTVGG